MTCGDPETTGPGEPVIRCADDLVEALGVEFSDEQLEAITAPLEPGVIIAGAGSGKTTVMAARVVWLVGTGAVRPEEVLGLTFTRKAAAELSERTRSALVRAGVIDVSGTDESGEQLIMTYDAFAARLVAEHGLRLGVEPESRMVTGAARFRLAARVTEGASGPFEHVSRLRAETVTDRLLQLDGDLRQHLVPTSALHEHAKHWRRCFESAPLNRQGNTYADIKKALAALDERLELAGLADDYQALKQQLGCHEFADQMAIAARLATEEPQVSEVLRHTFKVVLLDEYQDTSAAQATTLRGLFSGAGPDQGQGHPVTAVGDPFQAIYGWRGAAASNILQFAEDFPTADGQPSRRFGLTVNRRSGQTILDLANQLAEPLREATGSLITGRFATEPGGETVSGDETGPGAETGLLQAAPGAPEAEVRAATFTDWPSEASWIADQIVALQTGDAPVPWSQIAVLTRRNADINPIYGELIGRDVPTEIVGLGGLLALPEVADVVATLRVTDDVTANPDLIRLLTGPRWNIGPADLARLGERAAALATDRSGDGTADGAADGTADGHDADHPVLDALHQAVADVDQTEVASLLDAVEDPGEGFDATTLSRFAAFSRELAYLRRHSDEPLLDLCHRVVAVLDLEVELLAGDEPGGVRRRDQLGAFLDAVAEYADVDGQASLSGLLAYLEAEVEHGNGLEQAVPSDRDSVKLLTVHKAKGLEWDVVFLPALMHKTFPSDRVSDNWVTRSAALPADLRGDADAIPQLAEASYPAIVDYRERLKSEQLLAEDRLAYVAATRARRILVGSGHTWRPQTAKPREPSRYLELIVAAARQQHRLLAEAPPPAQTNPLDQDTPPVPWPTPGDADAFERRSRAADLVTSARRGTAERPEPLLLDEEETVAAWDADIDRLLAESLAARRGAPPAGLPESLSATQLLRLRTDPDRFARDLARPMPSQPHRRARFGTQFHRWVEQRLTNQMSSQPQLIDPDELDDRADLGIGGEEEYRRLCDAFAAGRYGSAVPVALEQPVALVLGEAVVRGRIDAVFWIDDDGRLLTPATDAAAGPTGGAGQPGRYQIVDWKTSYGEATDPWQLAIYRVAWAEMAGVAVESVDAVFYVVGADRVVRPDHLAGRADLERLLEEMPAGTGTPDG